MDSTRSSSAVSDNNNTASCKIIQCAKSKAAKEQNREEGWDYGALV